MKHTTFFSLLALLSCLTLNSFTPKANNISQSTIEGDTSINKIANINYYTTYFGCTDTFATITKAKFLNMLNKPICVKDQNNKTYPITKFQILYAERGLYLDSTDAPIIVTDYTEEVFQGDSLTTLWKRILQERLFKGDTIMFEKVTVSNNGKNYRAKNLKMAVVE